MKLCILLVSIFLLGGCLGDIRVETPQPKPDAEKSVQELIAEKKQETKRADDAIKTSQDAKRERDAARDEARAAYVVGDAATKRADGLDKQYKQLVNEEVGVKIRTYSIWTLIAGVIGSIGATILFARFPGKTTGVVLVVAVGVAALGIVGIMLAPHWITVAWIAGVALLAFLVGVAVYVAHHRDNAGEFAASEWKRYASFLPAEIREKLDAESKAIQPASIFKTVSGWFQP